jgi:hypothetical protein
VSSDTPSLGSTDDRFPARELLRNGLHLAALSGFAFTEPLLTLLGSNPAFFAAHESSRWDVILFGVVVALGPPIVLVAIEALAGAAHPRLRTPVHLVLMTALAALFALRGLRTMSAAPAVVFVIAALIGGAIIAFYALEHRARTFASALSIAPVLFLVIFIFFSPVHRLTITSSASAYDVESKSSPPIIFIQYDAFPEATLMDPDGKIDAKRFPNFGRLADTATWYRNATTAHENTTWSIPSIVDGRWPKPKWQPILADHPNNLFTLLGKRYQMDVYQSTANLCPPGSCSTLGRKSWGDRIGLLADDTNVVFQHQVAPRRLEDTLPSIDTRWSNFRESDAKANVRRTGKSILGELGSGQRPAILRGQIARMLPGKRPLLSYTHILLPHEPRQYLPDGRQYQAGSDPEPALDGYESFHDSYLTQQALQRAMLQVGFTDRLLGTMIDHLRRVGLWQKALVIITADHGEAFQRATGPIKRYYEGRLSWRRAISPANMGWVAAVPLIIKYPDQTQGRIDDRPVKTIDVLPTIASTLGIKMPFKVDGRSLRDSSYRGRDPVRVERSSGRFLSRPAAAVRAQRDAAVATIARLFGAGTGAEGLYRIGPSPDLHGRAVSSLPVDRAGTLRASLERASAYAHVDPGRSAFVPSQVTGRLRGGPPGGHEIAVAVNGRIGGTGVTFSPIGHTRTSFAVMVPPDLFRAGANRVTVYAIDPGPRLRLLGPTGAS